jgi:uncharacterized membrane protein YqjE
VVQTSIDDAHEGPPDGEETRHTPPPGDDPGEDSLGDSARRLYAEGEAVARSAWRTLDALQSLAGHEAALARAALPQAAMFAGIAIALGLAAWLYLMALLVAWLQLWLSWPGALGVATALSLLGAGACLWRSLALLRMSRFEGTRRQLRELRRVLRQDPDAPPAPPDAAANGAGATSREPHA